MSSSLRLFSVLLVGLLLAPGCASVQRKADDSSGPWPNDQAVAKASAEQPDPSRVTKPICLGCPKMEPSSESPSASTSSNAFALDTALSTHSGLAACFATASAEGGELDARPILELHLTPEGRVKEAGLVGSEWAATPLDQCVGESLREVDLGVRFSGRSKDVRIRWRVTSPKH